MQRKQRPDGLPEELRKSPDHAFAVSCRHCTDTCDSFGAYVSTYCHLKHEHLAGFANECLSRCRGCPDYEKRADPR